MEEFLQVGLCLDVLFVGVAYLTLIIVNKKS